MLTLTQGASSIVVAPEHGASLLGWVLDRIPIFRRALSEAAVGGNPHAMACFPLLPYCNRIGRARFRQDGTDYRLRPNFGDHPHTIHGIGWQRAWTVTRTGAADAILVLEHHPDPDWPFAFQAAVRYDLSESTLAVTLALTNRHDAPAPAGIGLHPYFPKASNPRLRFSASGAWHNGADALPSGHGAVPTGWHHAEPRPVMQSRLDNCFTGWDGTADILAGPASLRIEADPVFGNLQVFTPPWADFFCVEPVSHAPDAINRHDLSPDQAMTRLVPGATLAGTIRLILTGT